MNWEGKTLFRAHADAKWHIQAGNSLSICKKPRFDDAQTRPGETFAGKAAD